MFPRFSIPLSLLGFCFLVFSVARILHSIAMFLEDNEKPDFVVYPITFICFCLYFCVLPFTAFVYLLFHYPSSRSNKISYKDGQDSMKPLMEAEIRIAVQKETERMTELNESRFRKAVEFERCRISAEYKELLTQLLKKNKSSTAENEQY